jgi:hypothetical protein
MWRQGLFLKPAFWAVIELKTFFYIYHHKISHINYSKHLAFLFLLLVIMPSGNILDSKCFKVHDVNSINPIGLEIIRWFWVGDFEFILLIQKPHLSPLTFF